MYTYWHTLSLHYAIPIGQMSLKIKSVQIWQAASEDYAAWSVRNGRCQEIPCSCLCPRFDPYRVAQTLHGFSHRRVIVDDVHDRILVRLGLHPTSSPPSWHKSACASIESILRFNLRCSASCWSSAFVWERWTGCDDADSFANGLYETEAPLGASKGMRDPLDSPV